VIDRDGADFVDDDCRIGKPVSSVTGIMSSVWTSVPIIIVVMIVSRHGPPRQGR